MAADGAHAGFPNPIRTKAYVGGEWVESSGHFDLCDPATGRRSITVVDSNTALAEVAAEAAYTSCAQWRETTAEFRAQMLRRWFDLIVESTEPLARLIAMETAKPLAEARAEVAYGAAFVEWFAEEVRRPVGEVLASPAAGRRMLALWESVGVVAVITPWNFPLAMVTRKLAPALAAGCTVVLKPAEHTPLTALALADLAAAAGLPAGCLNVLPTSRDRTPEVVGAWMADERVRKISFTGSTAVGKLLARQASETLKRVSLELGGDAPFIVFDDADLDSALDALFKAKFRNAGQACIAANRVFVQSKVYDTFAKRVAAAVGDLKVGGADEGAQIGPLISERARIKVEGLVRSFLDAGARPLAGCSRPDRPGWFYAPTVLADVEPSSATSCEEIFGPVLPLSRFDSEEEVTALANASPYGLAAYVCTRNLGRAWRMASRLECGIVGVNEGAVSSAIAPFGGVKASGYGREGSGHGLADYRSLKYVCMGGLD